MLEKKIALVDTGASNLHSVFKALKFVHSNVEITKDPKEVLNSSVVVLPGVGAFGSVMDHIFKNKLDKVIVDAINSKKPFLGICVGLQALFEESEESSDIKGIKFFKGKVVKFKKAKKVPHIGWNNLIFKEKNKLIPENEKFYFVHSFYVEPVDKSIVFAETEYENERFASIIKKENVLAVQFHPEKSGEAGLELIKNFLN